MRICYIDESGDGQRPNRSHPQVPPAFVICGLVVESGQIADLTTAFLKVKKRFHPNKAGSEHLDGILNEVKGSNIRRDIRSGSRRRHRAAIGFLDRITKLLSDHGAGIVGRVWIKDPSTPAAHHSADAERSMYTYSVQNIIKHLQWDLVGRSTSGLVICDSRSSARLQAKWSRLSAGPSGGPG